MLRRIVVALGLVAVAVASVYSVGGVLAARRPPVNLKVELRCSGGDDAGTFELELTLTGFSPERTPVLIQVASKGTHVLNERPETFGRVKLKFPAPTSEGVHIMKVVRQKDGTVDVDTEGEMELGAAVDVNAESCRPRAGTRLFVGNLSMNTE
jgi:hypothetical protein